MTLLRLRRGRSGNVGALAHFATAVASGDQTYQNQLGTAQDALAVADAAADRDQAKAVALLIQNQSLAYAQAQADIWSAQAASDAALRTADYAAVAGFYTAGYAQQANATAAVDTAVGLPWTNYLARWYAAQGSWWNGHQGAFLAVASSLNSSQSGYRSAVNALYITRETAIAQAEVNWVNATADADYAQSAASGGAGDIHIAAQAASQKTWQNAQAASGAAELIGNSTA